MGLARRRREDIPFARARVLPGRLGRSLFLSMQNFNQEKGGTKKGGGSQSRNLCRVQDAKRGADPQYPFGSLDGGIVLGGVHPRTGAISGFGKNNTGSDTVSKGQKEREGQGKRKRA